MHAAKDAGVLQNMRVAVFPFLYIHITKNAPSRALLCLVGEKLQKKPCGARLKVELVGFEPTSKQGNHTLSTRLFRPFVFVLQQDPDHQLQPYPLKLHPSGGAHMGYSRFFLHRFTLRFGTTSLEQCLVPSPCDGIKPIYYTSIRQRERSCFRQLNC